MRKLWWLAPLAVVLLVACGGGSSNAGKPTPTPTPVPTPTPSATPDVLGLAALLEGTYAGTWNNTTFGSSGSVKIENHLDRAAGTMTSTLTLGGSVFGSPAPAPETFTYKVGATGTTFTTKSTTFGDVTVTINPPAFSVMGTNISSPNATAFEAHGTVTDPRTLNLDYTVTLRAGGTATGKATITRS